MNRHVWATIGRLIDTGRLPAPIAVLAEGDSLAIRLPLPRDVDEWVRHLGLNPAHTQPSGTRYGSVEFLPEPGWCGFPTAYVYCLTPAVIT